MIIKSDYSLKESSIKIQDAIKKLKELDYKVAILCDNELFGFLDFYNEVKGAGLKPIISQEMIIDEVKVILIAKNSAGFKELSRLSSIDKPTNKDLDLSNIEILISYNNDNLNKMKELAGAIPTAYKAIKNPTSDKELAQMSLINSLNLPAVPFDMAIHVDEKDYRLTNVVKAIGEKLLYDNLSITDTTNPDNYIKEKSYWTETYKKENLKNLFSIVSACQDDYTFGNPQAPKYVFVEESCKDLGLDSLSEIELFEKICWDGLEKRFETFRKEGFKFDEKEYRDRLEFEISVIKDMKFPGYMLIVWDIMDFSHKNKIFVGPGRGSAAGSLVSYVMNITNINPLEWGLLFERFLNPARVTMPDIDMDFSSLRRQEVIDYITDKYGSDNVAQIVAFGTFAAKAAVNTVSKVLSYPKPALIGKNIPDATGTKLSDAYSKNKNELDLVLADSHASRVWNYANQIEGIHRNLGIHAAGVVISEEAIINRVPVYNVDSGARVVQLDGQYLEDVDLIKFDILGLKTLGVIDYALKNIFDSGKGYVGLDSKKWDDQNVYEYISTGNTKGIFQIESGGMQSLCRKLRPANFEELTALIALYRPGPMGAGMLDDFVARKRGEAKVSYIFDEMESILKPILEPTYGVIVYQEQVMQIVQEIGGFSLGEADVIRRAMGKKNVQYMNEKKEEFADGAVKKGFNRENAVELFDLIEKFALYCFNKSHSASYAVIAYQTAYLKYYYPSEFMAALMAMNYDKVDDKVVPLIKEAKAMQIELVLPDVNKSTANFSSSEGKIYLGLQGLKGLGESMAELIVERRGKGYSSMEDFIERVRADKAKFGKKEFISLAKAGAFDCFGIARSEVISKVDTIVKPKRNEVLEFDYNVTDDDLNTLITDEKKVLGYSISSPYKKYQSGIDKFEVPSFSDLSIGQNTLIGWVESFKVLVSGKGNKYAKLSVIDPLGSTEDMVAFSDSIDTLNAMDLSVPVILTVKKTDDSVIVNAVQPLTSETIKSRFVRKAVAVVKEEVKPSSVDINVCDYKSLDLIEADTVNILDFDGSVLVTVNR
jgi:DNA polymerase-3 subunit alpha